MAWQAAQNLVLLPILPKPAQHTARGMAKSAEHHIVMRILLAMLMFYSVTTTSADMQYLLAWDEERWSCTATDRKEGTCALEVRSKPDWAKKD